MRLSPLIARGHRPADRLRILGAEVARDREEAVLLVRIHDRQLAALQRIALVRIDLAHHRHQRIAARDEQALLAIGREVHVLGVHRGGGGDRDRLFPGALHVEAGLALPLGAIHAVVEHADRLHVASASCAACRGRASDPTGRPPCRRRRAREPGGCRAGRSPPPWPRHRGAAPRPRRAPRSTKNRACRRAGTAARAHAAPAPAGWRDVGGVLVIADRA